MSRDEPSADQATRLARLRGSELWRAQLLHASEGSALTRAPLLPRPARHHEDLVEAPGDGGVVHEPPEEPLRRPGRARQVGVQGSEEPHAALVVRGLVGGGHGQALAGEQARGARAAQGSAEEGRQGVLATAELEEREGLDEASRGVTDRRAPS